MRKKKSLLPNVAENPLKRLSLKRKRMKMKTTKKKRKNPLPSVVAEKPLPKR